MDLALGGAQIFYVDLAERLSQRGHSVHYHLFAERENESLCDKRLYLRLNRRASAASIRDLVRCDVLHLDGYHTPQHKKNFGKYLFKCIETYHSEFSFRTSAPVYAPNRVAVSFALQKKIPLSCEVIYNGFDTAAFAPIPCKKEWDLAILGRIHPAKNHLLFLDICSRVARIRPLRAMMIGGYPWDDDYSAEVRRKISELQDAGIDIHVTGFVEHEKIPLLLNQARVLLVTSPSESFGRMAAEALACEVPVIANDTGGLGEIVTHGRTGFLTRFNDAEDFSQLALRLLDDDLLRERMGRQGRKDVEEKFSIAETVRRYEQMYERIRNEAQSERRGWPKERRTTK